MDLSAARQPIVTFAAASCAQCMEHMHAWWVGGSCGLCEKTFAATYRGRRHGDTDMAQPLVQPVAPTTQALPTDHWAQLMAAAQGGHGGAYRRLLSEIDPWLHRYYARRLPPHMIDDAVQETLIAVHTKRHTYTPERPFRPWLAAIARYKWIDRLRAMGREATDMLDDDMGVEGHESRVTSAIVLEDLLGRLKPAQANVIRLVKLQGFSIEEAASATGQSESLVKVNIHRGLGKLQGIVNTTAA
jgi:RNA polymerase sigma factor (sigma-70 family)